MELATTSTAPLLEVRQVLRAVVVSFPIDVFSLEDVTDDLAEFCHGGVDRRDRSPGVQVGVQLSLAPVLGDAGGVVADAVGEVVPEEVKPPDEVEVLDDFPLLVVEVGVFGPLGEGPVPGAVREERLQFVPAVVVAGDVGVLVLVRVEVWFEFGVVGRVHVQRHTDCFGPGPYSPGVPVRVGP